jgi:hypothetical protein
MDLHNEKGRSNQLKFYKKDRLKNRPLREAVWNGRVGSKTRFARVQFQLESSP